ncbi:MAG: hypothetical protein V4510_13165 [bacterium]
MPAKSQAQRKLLNARFGHKWVVAHHFDNAGPLPARVGKKKKGPKMKGKKKGKAKAKGGKKSGGKGLPFAGAVAQAKKC